MKRSDRGKDKGLASSFRILLLMASGPEALPVSSAFRTDSTSFAVIDMEFKVKSGIFRSGGFLVSVLCVGPSAQKQDGPGLCFCPEFGVSVRRKNGYNPGSAGSEIGERTAITLVWQVQSSASSFLQTLNPGWFGVRTGPNPGSAGSEFGERTGPNIGSEFGERTRSSPGSADSEFGERPVSFSELRRKEKKMKNK